jgi:putative transposase
VKTRQEEWTRSIAVGSGSFVENVKARLGFRAKGRDIIEGGEEYQLREGAAHYQAFFEAENDDIAAENTYLWDIKSG